MTSPPYDTLRDYRGFSFNFDVISAELARVLKQGGVICWIVGSGIDKGSETLTPFKQAIQFVEFRGLRLHDTMIYHKLNFSHPEKIRYHQVFEYIFVFSKGAPATFNPIMDKLNKTVGTVGNFGVNTFTEKDGSKSVCSKKITKQFGMRVNVWTGKTRSQERVCKKLPHPAMMPMWMAWDLIRSWSSPGEIIVDPFIGSGTVCEMAIELGRDCVGMDISEDYCKLAQINCDMQHTKSTTAQSGTPEDLG